jgi:serine/threonine protein phosphatase PrpC
MKCRCFCAMEIGPRPEQEDAVLLQDTVYQQPDLTLERDLDADPLVVCVYDSMGGHAAGEEASRFVCQALASMEMERGDVGRAILDRLDAVQQEARLQLPEGSGTTLAGAVVAGNEIWIFNAGDSRAYEITRSGLSRLTLDHSLVQELVTDGQISEKEAFTHPYRNVITYGMGPSFSDRWAREKIHLNHQVVTGGETFLFCSDGVSDLIEDGEMQQWLNPEPLAGGAALMERLRSVGFKDNTTLVLASLLPE